MTTGILIIMVIIEGYLVVRLSLRHKSDQEKLEALDERIIALSETLGLLSVENSYSAAFEDANQELGTVKDKVDMTTANGKPMFGIDPKTGKYA